MPFPTLGFSCSSIERCRTATPRVLAIMVVALASPAAHADEPAPSSEAPTAPVTAVLPVPPVPVADPVQEPTPAAPDVPAVPAPPAPRSAPASSPAAVTTAIAPLRVTIQCEIYGRTKACPAFLLGFVDSHPALLSSPRAAADVVVYATANQVALVDRMHLRFVGHVPGAPSVIELDVDLDTRGTDDEQRAALEPAFLRGIALFVAARDPAAVTVTIAAPSGLAAAKKRGSPWGASLSVSGGGNYTKQYRSANSEAVIVGRYMTRHFRALTLNAISGGINRQPALTLDDGTKVSLDSQQYALRLGAEAIHSFDDHWSLGISTYTSFEDPKGQYRYNSRTRAAFEWDKFRADDPRGNRLGIFYHLGYAAEGYNIRNEIGERSARYTLHGIDAVGSIRHDKITIGLELKTDVQLWHPSRRYSVTAAPFTEIQLGDHVDLSLNFSYTQRQLPAPDRNAIDPSDFQTLSRLQYAEPLSVQGWLSLTVHWDPTNGIRNDRLESI